MAISPTTVQNFKTAAAGLQQAVAGLQARNPATAAQQKGFNTKDVFQPAQAAQKQQQPAAAQPAKKKKGGKLAGILDLIQKLMGMFKGKGAGGGKG